MAAADTGVQAPARGQVVRLGDLPGIACPCGCRAQRD